MGALHVPSIDAEVEPGAVIEVSEEVAASLLEQDINWVLATATDD
jgi:hypothetical protein